MYDNIYNMHFKRGLDEKNAVFLKFNIYLEQNDAE